MACSRSTTRPDVVVACPDASMKPAWSTHGGTDVSVQAPRRRLSGRGRYRSPAASPSNGGGALAPDRVPAHPSRWLGARQRQPAGDWLDGGRGARGAAVLCHEQDSALISRPPPSPSPPVHPRDRRRRLVHDRAGTLLSGREQTTILLRSNRRTASSVAPDFQAVIRSRGSPEPVNSPEWIIRPIGVF
jgi:hypothetical protein